MKQSDLYPNPEKQARQERSHESMRNAIKLAMLDAVKEYKAHGISVEGE